VLSLLPAPFHVQVAEACIDGKAALVTASYVSKEMAALDGPAKAAGVPLLNEVSGLVSVPDHNPTIIPPDIIQSYHHTSENTQTLPPS